MLLCAELRYLLSAAKDRRAGTSIGNKQTTSTSSRLLRTPEYSYNSTVGTRFENVCEFGDTSGVAS